MCEKCWQLIHCGVSFDGLLSSTITTQCKSLFREYIPLDGFDSSTDTIGSGFLNLF